MEKILSYIEYQKNISKDSNKNKRLLSTELLITALCSVKKGNGVTASLVSFPWLLTIGNEDNGMFSEVEVSAFMKLIVGFGELYFKQFNKRPDINELYSFLSDKNFPSNDILETIDIRKLYYGDVSNIDFKSEVANNIILN